MAAGDWNLEATQLLEKAAAFKWDMHLQAPTLATCTGIGTSSIIDYLVCAPVLAQLVGETSVLHGCPIRPHFPVQHSLVRVLPGIHVPILARPRLCSPVPVFGPHLLPPRLVTALC